MNEKNKLILYYPLDDPIVKKPYDLIDIYIRHGVSVIEIALPTIHPSLDGQTIKKSMERVLEQKSIYEYFYDIKQIICNYPDLKIQLMAYYHIIEKIGIEKFIELVVQSGISYVLSPDATNEQLTNLEYFLAPFHIPIIRVAPYKMLESDVELFINSKGYIFQKSTDGKTGGISKINSQIQLNIEKFRKNQIFTPIVAAFGISTKEQVEMIMSMGANGVVIGSALFEQIIHNRVDEYLSQFDQWFVR